MRGDPLIGRRADISVALDDVGDLRPALPTVKKTVGGGPATYMALCPAALTDRGGIKLPRSEIAGPVVQDFREERNRLRPGLGLVGRDDRGARR